MDKKIKNVKIFDQEGERYIGYITVVNGKDYYYARPYYGEDGEIDPEVATIIEAAKKEETTNETKEAIEVDENTTVEEETTDKESEQVKDLVVYTEPPKKTSFLKSKKTWIAIGLAIVIVIAAKNCKKQDDTQTDDIKDDYGVEGTLLSSDDKTAIEQSKINYISKQDFYQGVTDLQKHMNSKLGYNCPLDDLYSFYYIANFENVSDEMFEELVEEGFMPDTTVAILEKALNVTAAVADSNMKSGASTIDYNYIFVDAEAQKQASLWQSKYNAMTKADATSAQAIFDEVRNYWMVSTTDGANTLPLGAKEMMTFMEVTNIYAQSASKGIEVSQAMWDSAYDFSSLMAGIENKFAGASIGECNTQLTK